MRQRNIPLEQYAGHVEAYAVYRPALPGFQGAGFEIGICGADGGMTQQQFDAAVDERAKAMIAAELPKAVEAGIAAFRAAAPVDPGARPGASGAMVNLHRPVEFSYVRTINALRENNWRGAELERDISQATSEIWGMKPEKEKRDISDSVMLPSSLSNWRTTLQKAALHPEINLPAFRAASEGSTAAGGALVPPEYLQDQYTLSLQGPVAFVNAPGVSDIPVKSNSVFFPRETVMPTSGAYAEAATITESDPTFGQQNVIIKKQAALNQFSNELLADAIPEYEQEISKSLVRSLTLYQDQQYLEGTGSGAQIVGLGSYANMTSGYTAAVAGDSYSAVGAADHLIDLVYAARIAGWEPSCWIMHPRTMQSLSKVKDSSNRYVLESIGGNFGAPVLVPNAGALPTQNTYQVPPWKALLLGIPVLFSNQIPITEDTSNGAVHTASHLYLGDFNMARRLVRQAIEMAISEHIYFTTDQTAVRVSGRSSIVLLQPAAFIKQTGIIA
jgi:HK97 family phage major capsid protein